MWSLEQVRALHATFPPSVFASFTIALVVTALQWNAVGATACIIWIAILGGVNAARLIQFMLHRSAPDTPKRAAAWLAVFRIGTLAAGVAWALGAYLLFPADDVPHQALLAFAIAGVCAAAASSFAIDRISVVCFVGPPVAVLVARFALVENEFGLTMGAMVAFYFGYLLVNGRRTTRWLRELSSLKSDAIERADALRASEERYEDLVESSSDLIQSVSPDGRLLFANRAWRQTLGYGDDEVVGRPIAGFIAPEYRGSTDVLEPDGSLLTIDLLAKDGRRVPVEGRVDRKAGGSADSPVRTIFRDLSGRIEAERKLIANERLLNSIIDHLPAMVFLKRADDLVIERINQTGLEMLGITADQIIGLSDFDFYPQQHAAAFAAGDRRALESEGAIDIPEEAVPAPDGTTRYSHTAKVALRDSDGRATHVLGISIDITTRKRAQEDLRMLNAELETRVQERTAVAEASERFLRATIDAVSSRIAVLDETGTILTTNRAWDEFGEGLGRDVRAVYEGENLLEIFDNQPGTQPSDGVRQIVAGIRDVIAGRAESVTIEHSNFHQDSEHWYMCRISRFDSDGPVRVVLTHHDVTEIHEARLRVAAGERMIASMDMVVPVGIFRLDAQGACRSVNKRYCEITGLSVEEVMVDGWRKSVHPDDLDRIITAWDEAREKKQPVHVEYRFRHRDGTIVWVIGQTAEILDEDGNTAGFVGTLTDITERRSLEAQLAQAIKMEAIGNLTGGMAHDFNNYLGIIIGNLDLLREHETDDPKAIRFIDTALRGAMRGAEMTRSLLAFSRRQPLEPQLTDVNKRVGGVIALLRRSFDDSVTIEAWLAQKVWTVRVDSAQFDSSLINLANNARDAMADGGTIHLSTRNTRIDQDYAAANPDIHAGDYVLVAVSDTGVGMNSETLSHVFEPFFTTKQSGHGTGLGLSMVYGFVRQSGGHVQIYSEPDRGTTVRIYLPRDRHVGVDGSDEDVSETAAIPGGSETILIAEDNEAMRQTTAAQLSSLGYTVLEAEDGEAALKILQQPGPSPDLLFSDVVMPGLLDGYALVRRAREIKPELAVLLTSGFPGNARPPEQVDEQRLILLGKPFRKDELATTVRAILDGIGVPAADS